MSAATSLERSAPSSAMDRRTVTLLFLTLMVVMLLASLSQMVLSSALPTLAAVRPALAPGTTASATPPTAKGAKGSVHSTAHPPGT